MSGYIKKLMTLLVVAGIMQLYIPACADTQSPERITASYSETPREGDIFDRQKVSVEAFWPDGSVQELRNFTCSKQDAITGPEQVTIETAYGKAYLNLDPICISGVTASYMGTLYAGDYIDRNDVSVMYHYDDGAMMEVDSFSCPDQDIVTAPCDLPVRTEYGVIPMHVEPIMVSRIQVDYFATAYECDEIDPDYISVKYVYEDGKTVACGDFQYEDIGYIDEEDELIVHTPLGVAQTWLDPVHVTGAFLASDDTMNVEGEMPVIGGVEMQFEDGLRVLVDPWELDFDDSIYEPMKLGENEYTVTWRGLEVPLVIEASKAPSKWMAYEELAEELEEADYDYQTDDTYVAITKHKEGDAVYWLTHVIVTDPSRLKAALANGQYGGEREKATSASTRLDWIVGVNGSNFSYETGRPLHDCVRIKNGQKMSDSASEATGLEICLTRSGELFSAQEFETAESLLQRGVTDTFCSADVELVSGGMGVNYGVQSEQNRYPRTAVGMVEPGEYWFLTAGSGDYKGGMTYDEIRDVMLDCGCQYARCLDGGGSATLVFNGELINTPAEDDTERAVIDFLYIARERKGLFEPNE